MAEMRIEMQVNGRAYAPTTRPGARLLDVLRNELGLTGTKEGCGAGECGTCSVFVNGALIKSCLMPAAKANGAEIVTVEGLAPPGSLSVVQRAFHKTSGSQCGYCIPGLVMAATATLQREPQADREAIKEGLGGNICRCTGYQKIIEAVELARDVMAGALPENALEEAADREAPSFIGANVRRQDAPAKVSGVLRYAGDIHLPGQLHMKVLRSTEPHARLALLDTTAAERMPGVVAVFTHRDVPGKDLYGVFVEDQPILARERVRYVGEGIAAVVAEDADSAERALDAIQVRYEPLPALFDAEAAMRPGAPVLHADYPDNVLRHVKIRKGDVARALAESDLVLEETYTTQRIEHAYLEPEAGLAYLDWDETLVIVSPSQNITHHRHMLARILARPINKVRMVMSPVGGGFGGKEDMLYQGLLGLAALKTRRPVKYVFSREESILASTKRHPFRIRYTMGLRRDGRILATRMDMLSDGGAYACSTPGVMNKAAILGAGPYAIDNVHIDVIGVYTNNTPSGAMRSFGAGQSEFATEAHLDLCAERLGLDPIALRRINALRDGAVTHTRHKLGSVSLLDTINAAAAAAGWQPGVPHGWQGQRPDVGGPGTREPCTLGVKLRQPAAPTVPAAEGRP